MVLCLCAYRLTAWGCLVCLKLLAFKRQRQVGGPLEVLRPVWTIWLVHSQSELHNETERGESEREEKGVAEAGRRA